MTGETRGNVTRQDVLGVLIDAGDATADEISEEVDAGNIRRVLRRLEDGGWIGKYRRDGATVYELSPLALWLLERDVNSMTEKNAE